MLVSGPRVSTCLCHCRSEIDSPSESRQEENMGTLMPVRCGSARCGQLWFDRSALDLGAGVWVAIGMKAPKGVGISIGNLKIGPCPRCGSTGQTPPGLYAVENMFFLRSSDLAQVRSALSAIQRQLSPMSTSSDVAQVIEAHPIIKGLTKFLPTNAGELAAYLALLITVLTQCTSAQQAALVRQPPVEITLPEGLAEVLSELKTNQQKSQKPPQEVPHPQGLPDTPSMPPGYGET